MASETSSKIFISHSRKDAAVADRLRIALERDGFRPFLDEKDIVVGSPWQERLGELIARADVVAFLISPDSIASPHCEWELNEAERTGKKVLPIICRRTGPDDIPGRLRRLNFAYVETEKRWAEGYRRIVRAIREDEAWTWELTRLTELAERWVAAGRPDHILLRTGAVAEADRWAAGRPPSYDALPEALLEFLEESRRKGMEERDKLRSATARGFVGEIETAGAAGRIDAAQRRLAAALVLAEDVDAELVPELNESYRFATRSRLLGVYPHGQYVRQAIASHDGSQILTMSDYEPPILWDLETASIAHKLDARGCHSQSGQFLRDGVHVLALAGKSCLVWNRHTGKRVATLKATEHLGCAASSPSSSLVAASDHRGRTFVWDFLEQRRLHVLENRKGVINSLEFSPDGGRLMTGCWDFVADIWDVSTGTLIRSLNHGEDCLSARFSGDGRFVVTAGQDRTAQVWDALSGEELGTLRGHDNPLSDARFSPAGQHILTASNDGTARLWTISAMAQRAVFEHDDQMVAAEFSPGGERILTASHDGLAKIWDSWSGELIDTLTGHDAPLQWACFCNDGQRILTASTDGTARLWDAAVSREMLRLDLKPQETANLSDDGARIAIANGTSEIRIVDCADPTAPARLTVGMERAYSALFRANDDTMLIFGEPGRLELVDPSSGQCRSALEGGRTIWNAAMSRSGERVATLHADSTARVWNLQTGELLTTVGLETPQSRREREAHKGGRSFLAKIRELQDGAFRGLGDHEVGFRTIACDAACTQFLTVLGFTPPRIWDAETGIIAATLDTGKEELRAASIAPDGRQVLLATAERCWTASSTDGLLLQEFQLGGRVTDALFSPSAETAAVVVSHTQRVLGRNNNRYYHRIEGWVELFDLSSSSKKVLRPRGLPASVQYSGDGRFIVTGDHRGFVEIWEARTGALVMSLSQHEATMQDLDLSADCTRLMTVTTNRISLWDTSHLLAWSDRPVLGLAAALANNVGTVTTEEREDILMRAAPEHLHAALIGLFSKEDVAEVGRRSRILRRPLHEGCYIRHSSEAKTG